MDNPDRPWEKRHTNCFEILKYKMIPSSEPDDHRKWLSSKKEKKIREPAN